MTTIAGTGISTTTSTPVATREAIEQARGRLAGRRPLLGMIFTGPNQDLGAAMVHARELAGTENLIGCTTAGEFTEQGLVHKGVAVMLVAGDEMCCTTAIASGMKRDWQRLPDTLVQSDERVRAEAASQGFRRSTTVVLTDGLATTGEALVHDLVKRMPPGTQIVGGAAGDEGEFAETRVAVADKATSDAIVALHVLSRRPWGIGVGHGLRPTTDPMKVTRAEGNVIYEIEGRPAFEAYRTHARQRGVALDPATAGKYLIGNELGVHVFDRLDRARAPLFVGNDGSLTCAGAVPQGASVSILDGEVDSMISAATDAASEAKNGLGGSQAAAVVVFDCVCRGMILGDRFKREIDAVRSVFGDVPVLGFLTYGEIARYPGRSSGWHNATAVVMAIPA